LPNDRARWISMGAIVFLDIKLWHGF